MTAQQTPLQKAALAIKKLNDKLEKVQRAQQAPIAIVGMGLRLPAGEGQPDIATPQAFREQLQHGFQATRTIDRWDIDAYYDADPEAPGKMSFREAGMLADVKGFDPEVFGITPREAKSLDPQHRLILECAWEALEHAGISATARRNSATGVYVGIGIDDYGKRLMRDVTQVDAYAGTGNAFCFASGRLSYALGLQGPSVSMDTACSSSLVAIHLAVKALRNGECDLALAGGVNLMIGPDSSIFLSKARAVAPDGRCKTFDASADGYGRGEGCGVLALKRLDQALADGDTVHAVIRGSAVKHDGPSSGLTVPSGSAQQEVIKAALADAQVKAEAVGYIEAHGTGTKLGDPIELGALHAVLGTRETPVAIGSVKANIGHLETGAGVISVIKAVLALKHSEFYPQPLFHEPNPLIDWQHMPFRVTKTHEAWQMAADQPRIAGVSGFGLSGTNAHLVLEQAPAQAPKAASSTRPQHVLTLRATRLEALCAQAQRMADFLANGDVDLGDCCHTANVGRANLDVRVALVAADADAMQQQLRQFAADPSTQPFQQCNQHAMPKIAWLFTGQGSQYPAMGKDLYATLPIFAQVVDACDAAAKAALGVSLKALLCDAAQSHLLEDTRYAQPALYTLEAALSQVWRSWGVVPRAVMGHSLGEYVAAYAAGVFSLEDGLNLVVRRAQLMADLPRGAMVVLDIDEAQATQLLQASALAELSIAALNSAENTVVSGPIEACTKLQALAEDRGIKATRLPVSHAFHSSMMEPMLTAYEQSLKAVEFQQPQCDGIANVSGDLIGDQWCDPAYWLRQIREPVRFADSVQTLAARGFNLLLEVGPKPSLAGIAKQVLGADVKLLPSVRKDHAWQTLLQSAGALYCSGYAIDWQAFDAPFGYRRTELPTYAFQRKPYWMEAAADAASLDQVFEQLREHSALSAAERALLPKLRALLEQPKAIESTEPQSWCYGVNWEEIELAPAGETPQGSWLVFAPRKTAPLKKLLIELKAEVSAEKVRLILASDQALASLPEVQQLPDDLAGIIFAWPLGLDGTQKSPVVNAWTFAGLQQIVALVAAKSWAKNREPKVWVTTNEARSVAGEDGFESMPGALWAMCHSLALELPQFWGGLLDMNIGASFRLESLLQASQHAVVALRESRAYTKRVMARAPQAPTPFETSGTWVISGGTGALGAAFTKALIQAGAQTIILLGRRANPENLDALQRIAAEGHCNLEYRVLDVADSEALLAFMEERKPLGIAGIIHAAGLPGVKPFLELEPADFAAQHAAKLYGTSDLSGLSWALEVPGIKHFAVCSSIAAVWGSATQAHYALANAYAERVVEGRVLPGVEAPGQVWHFGPMQTGMATEAQLQQLERVGLRPMDVDQAVAVALQNFNQDSTIIADIDDARFAEVMRETASASMFAHWQTADAGDAQASILEHIQNAEPDARAAHMQGYLCNLVATVMQIERPAVAKSLSELGLDSLMAVEMRNRLQRDLATEIKLSLLMEDLSLSALGDALLLQLGFGESAEDGDDDDWFEGAL